MLEEIRKVWTFFIFFCTNIDTNIHQKETSTHSRGKDDTFLDTENSGEVAARTSEFQLLFLDDLRIGSDTMSFSGS